jgi:hypothetical protein
MVPTQLVWNTPLKAQIPAEGDLSASIKSKVISVASYPGSLEIVWTGTPTGTLTIYAGNSHRPDKTDVDAWNGTFNSINALITPAIVQPAGAAGSLWIDLPIRPAFLYIDYARTSGSGVLTASFTWAHGGRP